MRPSSRFQPAHDLIYATSLHGWTANCKLSTPAVHMQNSLLAEKQRLLHVGRCACCTQAVTSQS